MTALEQVSSLKDITREVDSVMLQLYRAGKGCFIQSILASYEVADQLRNKLNPDYPGHWTTIIRIAYSAWGLSRWLTVRWALGVNCLVWGMLGVTLLCRKTLYLHRLTFMEDGDLDATIILLRTGVANEPNIAAWIRGEYPGRPVSMLSMNEKVRVNLAALKYIPSMFRIYWKAIAELRNAIHRLWGNGVLTREQLDTLAPIWMYLIARRLPLMCQWRVWAEEYLAKRDITHLYFTMNSILENAFMVALPGVRFAYVEHGFPRRDIPPLPCPQFVYGGNYSRYLKFFDPVLDVREIGTAYFSAQQVTSQCKTIVVASLQDWPQWKIDRVEDYFNRALHLAKDRGWKIVFRGRYNDESAFASHLKFEWDEVSSPSNETFAQCLLRIRPSLVWTTWSTAVLDANAMGVRAACFIDEELLEYFHPDFGPMTYQVIAKSGTPMDIVEQMLDHC